VQAFSSLDENIVEASKNYLIDFFRDICIFQSIWCQSDS